MAASPRSKRLQLPDVGGEGLGRLLPPPETSPLVRCGGEEGLVLPRRLFINLLLREMDAVQAADAAAEAAMRAQGEDARKTVLLQLEDFRERKQTVYLPQKTNSRI